MHPSTSDVQEPHVVGVALNEGTTRIDVLAHEDGEGLVGCGGLANRHLFEGAAVRVHRRIPQFFGVHLAQTLVALDSLGFVTRQLIALREAGFQLLYHNHDFEFAQLPDGTVGYDYIFANNDRTNLQNEIDVCWADYAGFNPAELLAKYAGGIPVVHMKDYKLEGKLSSAPYALIGVSTDNSMKDEGGWFEYRPLGCGQVDIPAVIKAAMEGGAQWLCVEQDEPSMGLDRLGGVAKSVEYLRSLDLM